MNFRACVVVPCYNHGAAVGGVVERLVAQSLAIGDSMCGFRLYPIARTLAIADRVALARGMSFDIDIVVRLAWEGLPIVNVPTPVQYPPGGISHFRMLRDNLRISATHTRLVT